MKDLCIIGFALASIHFVLLHPLVVMRRMSNEMKLFIQRRQFYGKFSRSSLEPPASNPIKAAFDYFGFMSPVNAMVSAPPVPLNLPHLHEQSKRMEGVYKYQ